MRTSIRTARGAIHFNDLMKTQKKKQAVVEAAEFPFSFETYRRMGLYDRDRLTDAAPSCFNEKVSIRRYRVTVELIDEPTEVLAERLQKLWRECNNHHHWQPLMAAGNSIGITLEPSQFGKDRKPR